MSSATRREKLLNKKIGLINEFMSLAREEKTLEEVIWRLEEKMAVNESAPSSSLVKPLEWSSSPETVRSLYMS